VGISPQDSIDSIIEMVRNVFAWCRKTWVTFKYEGEILDVSYATVTETMTIYVHFSGDGESVVPTKKVNVQSRADPRRARLILLII
jgi:hypothetical protein